MSNVYNEVHFQYNNNIKHSLSLKYRTPEEYSLVAKAFRKVLLVKKALDHFLTEPFHMNRFYFLEFLTKGAEFKIAPPRPELSKFVCQTNLLGTGGFLDCGIAKKCRVTNKERICNEFFKKVLIRFTFTFLP